MFPDRARLDRDGAARRGRCPTSPLAELKRLDAGGWFKPEFKGSAIPTFQEAIDLVAGQGGALSGDQRTRGLRQPRVRHGTAARRAQLAKNGLEAPSVAGHRSIIQSFSAESLQKMQGRDALPLVLLVSDLDARRGRG